MRLNFLIILTFLGWSIGFAQNQTVNSLKLALSNAKSDSAKIVLSDILYREYIDFKNDSALYYAQQLIPIAEKNDWKMVLAYGLYCKGYVFMLLDRYPESFQIFREGFKIAENPKNESRDCFVVGTPHEIRMFVLATLHLNFGHLMKRIKNFDKQLVHYKEAEKFIKESKSYEPFLGLILMNVGRLYFDELNELDTALLIEQNALSILKRNNYKKFLSFVFNNLGEIYNKKKEHKLALEQFHKSVQVGREVNNSRALFSSYFELANFYIKRQNKDSSLFYAQRMGDLVRLHSSELPRNSSELYYSSLSKGYELNNQKDSAYKYINLAYFSKESSYRIEIKNLTDVQNLSFEELIRAEQLEKEKSALRSQIRQNVLFCSLFVVLLIAFFLYLNNRQKQKGNELLNLQKNEIDFQRKKAEKALTELKSTQAQLIQSEKLASLGELTAGIAHEIQNPLNFVNNFAEVSEEMLVEMEEELDKGDTKEAKAIAADLKQNLSKINHHGQRASSIVKGMLEHSRASTGVKEPTDLNALADEYLRLAYHGLRAKDNNFNATLETHFDPNLPLVSVIPQDIGRVLLNLINNAFYAVNQRAAVRASLAGAPAPYQPTVTVSTHKVADQIIISVQDNGPGIPEAIREKIFQPFFTTKPTGQGTGLGLSLAHDIIKAHGGRLTIETSKLEGANFIIHL